MRRKILRCLYNYELVVIDSQISFSKFSFTASFSADLLVIAMILSILSCHFADEFSIHIEIGFGKKKFPLKLKVKDSMKILKMVKIYKNHGRKNGKRKLFFLIFHEFFTNFHEWF